MVIMYHKLERLATFVIALSKLSTVLHKTGWDVAKNHKNPFHDVFFTSHK
jgi:hypothetical protein